MRVIVPVAEMDGDADEETGYFWGGVELLQDRIERRNQHNQNRTRKTEHTLDSRIIVLVLLS